MNDIVFTPEEAVKIPFADPSRRDRHDKNGKLISKKRGRPRVDDHERPSKKLEENHAKKLRKDFGLTGSQVKLLFSGENFQFLFFFIFICFQK
jgi:hypothetical protein